jgi:hypothetical protein
MLVWFKPLSQQSSMAKTPHSKTTLTTPMLSKNFPSGAAFDAFGN